MRLGRIATLSLNNLAHHLVLAVGSKEMNKGLPRDEEITIYLTGIVGVCPLGQIRSHEVLRHRYVVFIALRQVEHLIIKQLKIENTVPHFVVVVIRVGSVKFTIRVNHIFADGYLTVCIRSIVIDRRVIVRFIRNGSVLVNTRLLEDFVIQRLGRVTECHHGLQVFHIHIGCGLQVLILTHAASLLHLHLTRTGVEHNLVNAEVGTLSILRIVVYLHREVGKVRNVNVFRNITMTIHLIPLIMLITAVTRVHGVQHTGQEGDNLRLLTILVLRIDMRHQLRAGQIA